jgi:tetratricopeptide (TPR) repeat protein
MLWKNAYGYIFEKHYSSSTDQRQIINEEIDGAKGKINWAHLCLGELAAKRYVHTILTTNFDQLALDGIIRTGLIPVVADGIESLNRIDGKPAYPQLVHLHGSQHTYNPRNSHSAVEETASSPLLIRALSELLREGSALVVVGYSGGEEGVMKLLIEAARNLNPVIYWVLRENTDEALSPLAMELLDSTRNGGVILGQDADVFFREIMQGVGLGMPGWMNDPVALLKERASQISKGGNADITAEIELYGQRLNALEGYNKQWEDKRSGSERNLDRARRLKLAGKFQEAIGAYREALRSINRNKQPADWAMTQNNLGIALARLGERESGTARLEEAVAAFHAALEERTRERVPLQWAATQNNLGNALLSLGERESDPARLKEAVSAYQAALNVVKAANADYFISMVENNLRSAEAAFAKVKK